MTEDLKDEELHEVRQAFDRLQDDAHKVDTMAALRRVEGNRGAIGRVMLGVLGAAAAAIILVVGFALARNNRDQLVTGQDDQTSSSTPGDGDLSDDGTDALVGTSWTLVSGTAPDGDIPIVDGWPVTLTFNDDARLGGTAACNGYGSTYSIDGNQIRLDGIDHTEMGCEPDVMASETTFIQALAGVDTVELGQQLTLTGPGIELVFGPSVPVPTADLVGQLWLLDTLIQGEAATNVAGSPATLLLTEDGTLEGSTGCRIFSGEYVIVGNSVEFTNWGLDGECAQQLADQDNSVVSVLGDGFTAEIDGDRLTLTSAGDEGLSYLAIDDVPDGASTQADPITVSELLDLRPAGVVNVSGNLVDNGGGWFLCESLDTGGLPFCASRWVVVTNVAAEIIDPLGPTTESGDFRSITYTEDPVVLSGELTKDGRFTLTGSPSDVDMTDDDLALLAAFADLGPTNLDTDTLRIADGGAQMGLGPNLLATRSADELTDPTNWQLDLEAFRGYVGPFSALEQLGNADQITTMVGPHDHCASPPAPIADELRGLRHLSLQPTGIDSCLQWWTVDIFVDDAGDIAGITLDLWEP